MRGDVIKAIISDILFVLNDTVVLNDTTQTILLNEGLAAGVHKRIQPPILPKNTCSLERQETYKEFIVTPIGTHNSEGYHHVVFSSDDLDIASEITIYETPQNTLEWRISKAGPFSRNYDSPKIQELATFDAMRKDASSRMETIVTSSESLENLSKQTKLCHAQCKNLVQKFVEGIKKMKETYFDPMSENKTKMWLLYNSQKLKQLISSLDKLLSTLEYAKDLVQACGKDWVKMGLILSIPMPPPGKNAYTRFDLLIDELSWNLDTIQYILLHLTGDMELKWNEKRCRYALERKSVAEVAAAEVIELAEAGRLFRKDRDDFVSQLQNGSFLSPEFGADRKNSWLQDQKTNWLQEICTRSEGDSVASASKTEEEVAEASRKSNEKYTAVLEKMCQEMVEAEEKVAVVVKKRLQVVSCFSTESKSIPECFWINPPELQCKRRLSKGGYKSIYKGDWLGQEVAIGILEGNDNILKEVVEKEALVMLKVQHPNIVDFLGCAFANEVPVQRHGLVEKCAIGYLVMEYMPEDLWKLRVRLAKAQVTLHPAVAVDILLQIVEAMIHMHNRGIIHRDLKAANCLVSPRSPSPKPSSQAALCFYTVKLTDFGTSKIFDDSEDNLHTVNQGTRPWMAPEVWGQPGAGMAKYTRQADVYSFGMTCYEVITGLMPFHEYEGVRLALNEGKRPSFPASVSCPEGLKLLMAKCWAQDPHHRPKFEEVRKDLWSIKYDLELQ